MKKLLLALSLLGVTVAAFGQGQIIFQNGTSTAITNSTTSDKAVTSTRVGFYINANTSATTLDSGWVRIYTTNLSAAGIFLGGTRTLTNDTGTASFPGGTAVAVQVRAWLTTAQFTDYETAKAVEGALPTSRFGVSGVLNITPAVIGNPAPNLINNGLQPFLITPGVPEPSSIALGLLGLGAIALFRRRK